jgi:hypothetical protein
MNNNNKVAKHNSKNSNLLSAEKNDLVSCSMGCDMRIRVEVNMIVEKSLHGVSL